MYNPSTYTVESVTSGHPDKVCDQISDAILDACLTQDPKSRVAVESFGSHGLLVLGGEVTTNASIDYEAIARRVYQDIGYHDELNVISHVSEQSPDIAMGVDTGGAGDQGIMYGYACDETPEMLPKAVVLVHELAKGLEALRSLGCARDRLASGVVEPALSKAEGSDTPDDFAWLGPDGKTQITIDNGRIASVLVSTQHDAGMDQSVIRNSLIRNLITPIVSDLDGVEVLVNPTGAFTSGGFEADAGLTGRKIMVDTYCGLVPHGGGAFSGKDATKVDRSAAYMCRFVAKQLVAEGAAKKCLVSVAYAIGRVDPLMVHAIDEHGNEIDRTLLDRFDFRPQAIIERLGLREPIFRQTAAYGHFGKAGLPWEALI